jgi:hypothetical protein
MRSLAAADAKSINGLGLIGFPFVGALIAARRPDSSGKMGSNLTLGKECP